MIKRLDKNCEGCDYDRSKPGNYFCLCCTLMNDYVPHRKEEKNNKPENEKNEDK